MRNTYCFFFFFSLLFITRSYGSAFSRDHDTSRGPRRDATSAKYVAAVEPVARPSAVGAPRLQLASRAPVEDRQVRGGCGPRGVGNAIIFRRAVGSAARAQVTAPEHLYGFVVAPVACARRSRARPSPLVCPRRKRSPAGPRETYRDNGVRTLRTGPRGDSHRVSTHLGTFPSRPGGRLSS